jgi:D-alanyl-D-alanine carboxypeptidase
MLADRINTMLGKAAKKSKTLQFAMHIPAPDINYAYSSTVPDQRFHSASVGKLMTATLIFMAIEQGKLSLDRTIQTILEPRTLDRLFVFKGQDYQNEITVGHLLGHLSGINDYFDSRTFDGSLFVDDFLKNPDTFWKPGDLLDFTRNRQSAVASPGQKFFYSDTGYILLGLIVETIYQMQFHKVLDTYIFNPAGMQETTLCFYGAGFDQKALAPLYINGVDVRLFTSLSCDFSGGGLSTTATDLLKFLDHLQNFRCLSQRSLDKMANFSCRYRRGLYYGLGMMEVRFGEFFFLLKTLPRLRGHLGVTGVHAWYDPVSKATYALNVGNTKDMAMSFRLLIGILQLVQRELRTQR